MTDTAHSDPRPTDELIAAALAEQDDDTYRELVLTLKYRATREVLEAARALTESDDPDARCVGVDILGELGIPERAFPTEAVDILLGLLEHEANEDAREHRVRLRPQS